MKFIWIMTFFCSQAYGQYWWQTEKPDFLSDSSLLHVRQIKDVSYGLHTRQKLDFYIPEQSNGKALFLVHGGAWMSGDKRSSQLVVHKVNYWASQGYTVVSTNYRLVPEVNIVSQIKDVYNSYLFSQNYLKKLKVEKIIMIGHSSGGHIVSLLASKVIPLAVISLDGAGYDIREIMTQKHAEFFDFVFTQPELYSLLSPEASKNSYLLVCSKATTLWCKQAHEFKKNINLKGGLAKIIEPKIDHQEVNSLLGLDNSYTKEVDSFIKALR